MTEKALTKQQVISELTRSPHKELSAFLPISKQASHEDPEFFGRLVAWNLIKGQIRDSKVALPVIALLEKDLDPSLRENAVAHIASLDTRLFTQAAGFSKDINAPTRVVRRLIERYLRELEADPTQWDRVCVRHRRSLHRLYTNRIWRIKPSPHAQAILFRKDKKGGNKIPYPAGSVFEAIEKLKDMSAIDAANAIHKFHIPALVIMPALGPRLAEDTDLALALIKSMSPTELTTNVKLLEKMGVKDNPALRAALEEALGKASSSSKNVLKTTKAAKYASEELVNENLSTKLKDLQERQLNSMKGIEGNWAFFGDKSGSMTHAIDIVRQVTAFVTKMIKGESHLVFFDSLPRYFNVTGKSYEEINELTKMVSANGGTSIGCCLQYLLDANIEVDGIAIVSDGGEGAIPHFHDVYPRYSKKFDKEVPIYFYRVQGTDPNLFSEYMKRSKLDMQEYDLTRGADSYSLPNLIGTMRTNRYGLVQEILDTPLKTLDSVLKRTKGVQVLPRMQNVREPSAV